MRGPRGPGSDLLERAGDQRDEELVRLEAAVGSAHRAAPRTASRDGVAHASGARHQQQKLPESRGELGVERRGAVQATLDGVRHLHEVAPGRPTRF